MEVEQTQKTYLTIKQFALRHPWPSESAMRAIIQKADETGFTSAFIRYGRRILIDANEFFLCLERNQKKIK